MKRKIGAILLASTLFLTGCGQKVETSSEKERTFTDSLGREVYLPETVEKIAVSGPSAQIMLFALCPEKLVGVAEEWDASAKEFLATEYYDLPLLGQLYGGKGELNLETLLASGAQVVIDVGEPKDTAKEDLDALQAQTGIPFVHITATLENTPEAYRMLGELTGSEDAAETLASFCGGIYEEAVRLSQTVEKTSALYVTGTQGHHVIARDSYHSEILDMMCDNLAVVDSPTAKGSGNEVGLEQIMVWDPEVLIFSDQSVYDTVAEDPAWQTLSAVQSGRYYEVPAAPYNWMGFPPSVQRSLGLAWLGELLYSDTCAFDFAQTMTEAYRLFFHCDLTQQQLESLTAKSIGKVEP